MQNAQSVTRTVRALRDVYGPTRHALEFTCLAHTYPCQRAARIFFHPNWRPMYSCCHGDLPVVKTSPVHNNTVNCLQEDSQKAPFICSHWDIKSLFVDISRFAILCTYLVHISMRKFYQMQTVSLCTIDGSIRGINIQTEILLSLTSHEISSAINIHICPTILLTFSRTHGSVTVMLGARFQNVRILRY